MVRFACPRCKTVLERPEQEAGGKFSCPGCGQRLQVPASALNKTLLGEVNIQARTPPAAIEEAAPAAASDVQIRLVHGREHVVWPCPLCQAQVSVALDLGQTTVRCPQCVKRIDVPRTRGGGAPQQIKAGPGAAAPSEPELLPEQASARRGGRRPRDSDWDDDRADDRDNDRDNDRDDRDLPRRRRGADWEDDAGIRRYSRTGRPVDEADCARSSTTGFLCSIISVGLLFVAFVIWIALIAERRGGGEVDPFVFLILILGLISFVLGLIGVVFSSRGLDPINQRNRGLAVAGLVCGILGMVVGLIGSAFFFCVGMVLMSVPWR